MSKTHQLLPERKNLHGHFSRDLPPVLTIAAGDTIQYTTLDAGWGLENFAGGAYQPRPEFEGRVKRLDDGHALIGPVAIEGAEPGMTLAVEINTIRPGKWGWCLAGGWNHPVNRRLRIKDHGTVHAWELDAEKMIGRNHLGHEIALRPFMGVMGMPPVEPGIYPTAPPRPCGGNMDCKELVVGTTLFLPISVAGGLFSVGDGHAVQGDGEVSITAIECPMELVELTFHLRDDFPLEVPAARTPDAWITLGFDKDLNKAMYTALEAMLALMGRLHNLERLDALALASLAVDLRITQIVNGVRGVHAVLPHDRIRFPS